MSNVYIVDGARTAFTEFGGSFAKVDATNSEPQPQLKR